MELFHEAALNQCNSIDLLWYWSWIMNSLPIHSCLHVTPLQPCSSRSPLQFTFFFWWVPWGSSQHSSQAVLEQVGGYWAGAPRQEWPVGAQMDFLQQTSSPKEMHHGTRAVLSLFTALSLLSDFFSSHYTWCIPGSTVTGCLSCCIYTQFPEQLTSRILATDWDCTRWKIFTMPSFASHYFTASYCSTHFFVRSVPMTSACFVSGFKTSSVIVTTLSILVFETFWPWFPERLKWRAEAMFI